MKNTHNQVVVMNATNDGVESKHPKKGSQKWAIKCSWLHYSPLGVFENDYVT